MRINRDQAIVEHAVTSTACLSSGLDIFCPQYSSPDRCRRLIRGLHGFHVFAHQIWIDCVLDALSPREREKDISQLLSILGEMSEKLAGLRASPSVEDAGIFNSEPRLELLRSFPPLYRAARDVLLARNQKVNCRDTTGE